MPDRIVRRLNGPRGSALLAVAWACLLHGVAYTPLTAEPLILPLGLELLSGIVPLVVYGALWCAAGILALVGAFRTRRGRQRDHADAWGHGAAVGMFLVWGVAYLSGWVFAAADGEHSRAWITGGMYVAVAVIVASSARTTNPALGRIHS